MPRHTEPLTDTAILNAKPKSRPYKLFDGRGLFLLVTDDGGKWWRLKYRFEGKEKQLSLGKYPVVSLVDARSKRDEAKRLLANGINPSEQRKDMKNVGRFSAEIQFMRDRITEKKLSLEISIGVRAMDMQLTEAELQHIGTFVINGSSGE
jgi:hypothetical protein